MIAAAFIRPRRLLKRTSLEPVPRAATVPFGRAYIAPHNLHHHITDEKLSAERPGAARCTAPCLPSPHCHVEEAQQT